MKFGRKIKSSMLTQYIFILLILLIVPAIIFSCIAQKNILELETQSAEQYLSSNLKVVSSTVDGVLENLEHGHTSMILDTEFIHSLKKLGRYDTRDPYTDYKQTNVIKDRISYVAVSSNYVYSVYAYSLPANRIFSSRVNWDPAYNNYDFEHSSWFSTFTTHDRRIPWVITNSIEDGRSIITSYRSVHEYETENYAVVSINVDVSAITEMLDAMALNSDTLCLLIDRNGSFITGGKAGTPTDYQDIISMLPSEKNNGLCTMEIAGKKHFVFFMQSEYSKFTYAIAAPASSIETSSPIINNLTAAVVTLVLFIIFLFLLLSYFYFYTPIRTLFYQMGKVEQGDFSTRLPSSSSAEIDYINTNFNRMVSNIQRLINDNYVIQLVSKEAKLKAMQSKINEHFLYNTLDTIHWKARIEDAPETSRMIFLLADFYRLNLSSGQEFIPVDHIVTQIQCYLEIQKIRLGEMMEYHISCDESLKGREVLKYLFQPIVENAIIHGGKKLASTEILDIRFQDFGTYMRFTVSDNGTGIDAEKLSQLTASIYSTTDAVGDNFALKLIHTQLKLNYGDEYSLHITSDPGQGCTVWFDLPLTRKKEGEETC